MQQKNEDTFNRPRRYLHKPMKVPSRGIEGIFMKKGRKGGSVSFSIFCLFLLLSMFRVLLHNSFTLVCLLIIQRGE